MEKKSMQKLFETLADVFEVLFSIPLKSLEDSPPRKILRVKGDYLEVRVDVVNGSRFPTFFFLPRGLAQRLANNLVDQDERAESEADVNGAAKEAVGITVGGLLGRIDPEAKCTIGVPMVRTVAGFSPDWLSGMPGTRGYETEFGYLWMDLGDIDECF
jgi:hypothetical protein